MFLFKYISQSPELLIPTIMLSWRDSLTYQISLQGQSLKSKALKSLISCDFGLCGISNTWFRLDSFHGPLKEPHSDVGLTEIFAKGLRLSI